MNHRNELNNNNHSKDRQLRITHVTDNLNLGGLQRLVVSSANLTAQANHTVTVCAGASGVLWRELDASVAQLQIKHRPRIWSTVALLWALRRHVATHAPHVIHAHQRKVALLANIATWRTRTKVVEHVHNTFKPGILSALSFRSDHLIACGSSIRHMLITTFHRQESRVTHIPNAVAPPPTAPHPPSARFCQNTFRPRNLIGIGRLTNQKRPDAFVRTLVELEKKAPGQFVGKWYGDGPLRNETRNLIEQIGAVNVHFEGVSTNVYEVLHEADVLLLTSAWEGLPLTILEALAAGRGVIAPDVGSCSEAVIGGYNGLVYDAKLNPQLLAELIIQELTQENIELWSANSRKMYDESFTPDKWIDSILTVYANLANPEENH